MQCPPESLPTQFKSVTGRQWKSKPKKENPSLEVQDYVNALPQGEETYPRGLKLVTLTFALGLSCFLVALDNTIISTAIPKITDTFNSLQDTTAGTQLLFGKLYTHFSIKWVYVASIALFEIGTLLCGAAPSSSIFIVGRAVAGVGNAGIFSGALVIIANSVPLAKRPLYTGMIGGMGGIGCVTGPIIGGIITDKLSFRYCFYLSLPLGGIALSLVIFLLKIQPPNTQTDATNSFQRLWNFDPFGTLVFIPAITSLLLVLQWGGSKYSWMSGPILGLLIVFMILIAIFIAIQIVARERATIPPRILLRRSVWTSSLFAFALGGAFIIVTFYLPIWFQVIHGDSAARSGIHTLPVVISLVAGSVVAGGLITLIGYYAPFMILASILTMVGTGLLTNLRLSSTLSNWMPFEILCGLGVGFGIQQPMLAAQTVLDPRDVPTGTALVMFSNTLGSALFVSIAQNVFTNTFISRLTATVPSISATLILSAGADSLKAAIPPRFFQAVLIAYNEALSSAFIVAMSLAGLSFAGAFLVEWRSVKGRSIEVTAA
ncbi:major facilitator superfamily transporter [Favolaschia claudopus]|uniref:Major facilitator superfamily transporter n=1 Tax=Favolaschia claudopus TaxID=2862362 RepID=A0AAW0DDD3_9AGAR